MFDQTNLKRMGIEGVKQIGEKEQKQKRPRATEETAASPAPSDAEDGTPIGRILKIKAAKPLRKRQRKITVVESSEEIWPDARGIV